MHFACFRKKATTSLKKTSKTSGASRNIKDMLHRDASPAITPATPAVKPSSAPTSSQAKEASGPSAMEVDSVASTELAIVGEQAMQESTAQKWLKIRLRMPSVVARRWRKLVLLPLEAPLHPRKP